MAHQNQLERLQRLRSARQGVPTRLEPVEQRQSPGASPWPPAPIPQRPAAHGRPLLGLLLLFVVAVAVVGGIGYVLHSFHSAAGGPPRTVRFEVQRGEGLGAIAADLERQGLVSNSLLFQLYFRLNGGADAIRAGTHVLSTSMTMDQVAQALQVSPPPPRPVDTFQCCTFLAGKRAEEIGKLLDKYGVVSYDDFMYQVRHGSFAYWFLDGRPPDAGLEGFLYPGTYVLHRHDDAHRVVDLMLASFGRRVTPAMAAEAARAHRSIYEVLTIASIVQRESSIPQVQRYIASVYYNRLTNVNEVNMRLGADPTVQYALGYRRKAHSWWEPHLTQAMIAAADSPYNTYKVQGLPPGPICSPGHDALLAALRPARSSFLYFQVLAKGKVPHTYFCDTSACHDSGGGVRVY